MDTIKEKTQLKDKRIQNRHVEICWLYNNNNWEWRGLKKHILETIEETRENELHVKMNTM